MVKADGIYKCELCGNVVSVIEAKDPAIICCGQEMTLMEEKTDDEGQEKHVPIIEKTDKGVKVKIGSVPHPMEDEHYIKLVQLIKDGEVIIGKRLKSGDKPEADFCCIVETDGLKARIYCNLHGLWINKE